MVRLAHRIGRLSTVGLLALLALPAGCAQFQWSGHGPGAPGWRDHFEPPPPSATAPGASLTERGEDEAETPPEPFSTEERTRIAQVEPWVEQVASRYSLDPDLINAVIWVESRFQTRAKSSAGARGLMQLMPATAGAMAKQLGRPTARISDPEFNIEAGSLYLLNMLDRYDGDETLALAAYNAGAGNVSKWMKQDGELPPRSLEYVELVQQARRRFVAMRGQPVEPYPIDERDSERTMLAAASTPTPAPRDDEPPQVPEPASTQPARNPLAPEPGVYRPTPTPEPPLAETPYPPNDPDIAPRELSEEDTLETSVDIAKPRALPSVLD